MQAEDQTFALIRQDSSVWSLWLQVVSGDWFQFLLLFFGGWACILGTMVISLPILILGYLVYTPLKLRFGTFPHKQLAVGCDICGIPAVGYKELRVTTGLLFA